MVLELELQLSLLPLQTHDICLTFLVGESVLRSEDEWNGKRMIGRKGKEGMKEGDELSARGKRNGREEGWMDRKSSFRSSRKP